jgi:HAD superfamily hydrolase (TIGR01509 family)
MRFADLDAVTVDAFGTLLALRDPVPALTAGLLRHGITRDRAVVERAFGAEGRYYREHALAARDPSSLAALRRACTTVFLDAAEAEIDVDAFTPAFVDALVFEPIAGAVETLEILTARGLALAVVANWEVSLRDHLRRLGLDRRLAAVVISAEVGVAKPDPLLFRAALDQLGVRPERSLHVGDDAIDEQGALAAGMHFAWAPLVEAFREWS